jgi:hypothetical protein
MPVVILAQFLATWALSGALIGVVFGPKIGFLIGLLIAVFYWVPKRIRIATPSPATRRPIHDR